MSSNAMALPARRARSAGYDVPQKALENRVEVIRRLPERRVARSIQPQTAAFPQIGIGDGVDIIEVDQSIGAAVHHRERDRAALHGQSLVDAFAGARGLEQSLAETTVRACHGLMEQRLRGVAEDGLDKG